MHYAVGGSAAASMGEFSCFVIFLLEVVFSIPHLSSATMFDSIRFCHFDFEFEGIGCIVLPNLSKTRRASVIARASANLLGGDASHSVSLFGFCLSSCCLPPFVRAHASV